MAALSNVDSAAVALIEVNMQQSELIQLLEIADSTFRGWRAALDISAKKQYPQDEVDKFVALKDAVSAGQRFEDVVRELGGNSTTNGNGFSDALVKGLKPQLQKQADAVGAGLAVAFEDMVWGSFLKHVGKSKGSRFEEMANNFTLGIDNNEPMEAFLLESSTDEE